MLRNIVQRVGVRVRNACLEPGYPSITALGQPLHTSAPQQNQQEDDGMEKQRIDRIEKTLNQVMLLGRVGGNPEKRGTEEHPVVTFSLATHNTFRKGDDLIQQTDWHRIAIFKPYLRESVYRYLGKGQRVMVQGRIGYLERRDTETDQLIMKTSTIIADDVIFFNTGSRG